MRILLKNATLINEKSTFHNQKIDVLIVDGILSQIATQLDADADQVIKLKDLHLSCGWFDPNVSFGEPGFEERETLENGLLTAAKSGFTHILLNPNTAPILSSQADIRYLLQRAASYTTALHISAALSENSEGNQMASLYDMHKAGALAYGDFNIALSNPNLLRIALDYVQSFNGIIQAYPIDQGLHIKGQMHEGTVSTNLGVKGIPEISETVPLSRDLQLLAYTNGKLHIPYISSAAGVELIRNAKKQNLDVSCSVGIAHLLYTDQELTDFDPNFKIYPPLRGADDQKALRQGLLDGTIDMVSSLHQPINPELKNLEFVRSEAGSIGLEAAFKVLQNQFPLEQVISFLTRGKKRFGIDQHNFKLGTTADLTLFTPNGSGVLSEQDLYSTSKNCLFNGATTKGNVYGCIRGEKIQLNSLKK
ncbi:MAG: dihydroorotase [Flavobacteriaceae bacterium]